MSKTGNFKELGPNLMRIIQALMNNDNLTKLLYYTNDDPLSKSVPARADIFKKRIIFIPVFDLEDSGQSTVSLRVLSGNPNSNNDFTDLRIDIEVLVPNQHWEIKDTNLRPYAIMSEIAKSLNGLSIDGLGKLEGGRFALNYITEEVTVYEMFFYLTTYA